MSSPTLNQEPVISAAWGIQTILRRGSDEQVTKATSEVRDATVRQTTLNVTIYSFLNSCVFIDKWFPKKLASLIQITSKGGPMARITAVSGVSLIGAYQFTQDLKAIQACDRVADAVRLKADGVGVYERLAFTKSQLVQESKLGIKNRMINDKIREKLGDWH